MSAVISCPKLSSYSSLYTIIFLPFLRSDSSFVCITVFMSKYLLNNCNSITSLILKHNIVITPSFVCVIACIKKDCQLLTITT
ncbi:hypothetical protein AQUCO_00201144v1 [Aquilegia coerulea]|uniref:Uncharacterized protein n=1 Tax=Aquilegia coerulea TaxID=218851 RepID=A0A2G5F6E7_AQUCA|nr:hypothetical protein AQUCO_00201144v1 [Aquilegia coerulea]